MSRRRRPAPPLLPGYIRGHTTSVVCTDRGQHAGAVLYEVRANPATRYERRVNFTPANPAVLWAERPEGSPVIWRDPDDGAFTYRLHCHRCGRDVRLREEKLLAALAAVATLNRPRGVRPRFDISLIP
jgi:hypothetical protein